MWRKIMFLLLFLIIAVLSFLFFPVIKEMIKFNRTFSLERYLIMGSYKFNKKILVYSQAADFMDNGSDISVYHKDDYSDKLLLKIRSRFDMNNTENLCCNFKIEWIDSNQFYFIVVSANEKYLVKIQQ